MLDCLHGFADEHIIINYSNSVRSMVFIQGEIMREKNKITVLYSFSQLRDVYGHGNELQSGDTRPSTSIENKNNGSVTTSGNNIRVEVTGSRVQDREIKWQDSVVPVKILSWKGIF